ncbi:septation ring formation regulator EzrA [Bacillaceae bacterium CLA-AA-H227]|uniref:Septation ring formation regulator EzrA n=1 Tax=Robertmurraya yapensis (ex Hitch et al 2024) TaxID=3133160 RepID=A0ACC6SAZ2_9BACI
MEFIIVGLVLILILYITGYVMKKKYYKDIDRLEAWKIDVMNRPVLDEMSKVKKLNMTGQTEELFEKWRREWDEIVTKGLPDVEEYLFDAEEYIDKYRFNKAKQILNAIEKDLTETEENVQALIDEIKDLVGSEEKSRNEIDELKDLYRVSKKKLLTHHHNYGIAEKNLELQLDEIIVNFQQFDELTSNGNYLNAREIVLSIKAKLEEISNKLEIIPELLLECQSKIPSQLQELKEGHDEMVKQGYILDHIQLDKEIERIETVLDTYKQFLEKTETEEVENGLVELKEGIELLYDLLEEEVNAKQFLKENQDQTKQLLELTQQADETLKSEIEEIKHSYHLSESKLEEQSKLEKLLQQLMKRYELLETRIENDETAHSLLKIELSNLKAELEQVNSEFATFFEMLQMLRKDELAAREKVQELARKMAETIKLASKNNIPGVPEDYLVMIQESKESISEVKARLEEKPLDIPTVQNALELAVINVEKTYDITNDMIETVMLVEKVIQYGNRYRSRYASVDRGLREAEKSFRGYDYQAALEQAATAIEEIEPGALKRIEAMLEEQVL